MTEYTAADLFTDALEQYGVEHVFGNPGTTELPVMDALSRSDLEYVLGLHEDVAVGMAAGYANTRRHHHHRGADVLPVGVVNLHIAPGLAHGLGNVYAANFAGAPLIVTAGNHERDFRHEEPSLFGDLVGMVDQYTKWSDEVLDADAFPTMLRRAFRVALTPPTGPVFLGLPVDVMMDEADPGAVEPLGPIPSAGRGDPEQVARAADLLVEADDPTLVVGDHLARSGADAVEAAVGFAEATGAKVFGETMTCEANFPTGHDQWVAYLPPVADFMSSLLGDGTIVFAGCGSNTTLMSHEEPVVDPGATRIHVSDAAWEVGKNQPVDAAVVGDPGLVLGELAERVADRLPDGERDRRLEVVSATHEEVGSTMESISVDGTPEGETRAAKYELVDAMRDVVPDAYLIEEGITSKFPLILRWDLQPDSLFGNKGGGLGFGLPASIGAALAESTREDPREVVGYVGDGSYLYYPHAVYSAVRHDLDLTVVVPDNRNYRILKDNTVRMMGGSEDEYEFVGMDFEPPVDIVANAESHGARARLVGTADEIRPALEEAVGADGVDVLDVLVHD